MINVSSLPTEFFGRGTIKKRGRNGLCWIDPIFNDCRKERLRSDLCEPSLSLVTGSVFYSEETYNRLS